MMAIMLMEMDAQALVKLKLNSFVTLIHLIMELHQQTLQFVIMLLILSSMLLELKKILILILLHFTYK